MQADLALAQRVVDLLDELIKTDSVAMKALIASRVPCGQELADHPTVQCGEREGDGYEVGLLGILNGLCGTLEDGWGAVSVVFEDDKPVGARLLTVEDRKGSMSND